ncbi:MAG: DUF4198 domain-containing protein [Nitrospirae bacterium]|nr:DUF4198 domain-containing protein [Nitrospirota bacterium]
MNKRLIFFLAIIFMAVSQVSAHDAWIQKKGDNFVIVYGHGSKLEPYDFSKIKDIKAYDVSGNSKKVSHKEGEIIGAVHDAIIFTLFFDNGYWVNTTDGWKNLTKREALQKGLQIVIAERSLKFHKYFLKWAENFAKPLGIKYEIIPLKNPLLLKAGDSLPIKVLLDGKPVENASISTAESHDAVAKTDKDGLANVIIKKTGFCLISAFTERQIENDPDADKLYLSANIAFEIK